MKIAIKGTDQIIYANKGDNLFEVLKQEGVYIPAICGGKGTCGKCKVKVLSGKIMPYDDKEKKALSRSEQLEGYCLACKVNIIENLCIQIEDHKAEDRKSSLMRLPNWFMEQQRNKKLMNASQHEGQALTYDSDYRDQRKNENQAYFERVQSTYGVAFDIGTTTVVGALWNINSQKLIDVCAVSNPQTEVGADVISRIQYCLESDKNEEKLSSLLHDSLNTMIQRFVQRICNELVVSQVSEANVDTTSSIVSLANIEPTTMLAKVCLVGNTAMSRIAQELDVKQLIKPPFPTEIYDQTEYIGVESRLTVGENTRVVYLSGIGGHVGSDITAMILATNLENDQGTVIAIDIGTNGEIVLARNGEMIACSTAAGPAFEGACIRYGMRADIGAIEEVTIDADGVTLGIIKEEEAKGICGSGLVDAIAAMLTIGIVDETGRIRSIQEAINVGVPKAIATRIIKNESSMQFVLQYRYGKDPIVITQEDIRQVQLAKGAILAGVHILLKQMGITTEDEIDQVYLAGAFGSYLKIESARRIGLLPNIELNKITSVGNAAGIGASMAVLDEDYLKKATKIAQRTKQIELSLQQEFQQEFIECMNFNS